MTGLHAQHQNVNGLAALVANRTIPSVGVRVILLEEEGKSVARIELQAEPLFVGGELDVGFFRIPLPHLDRRSFREAFANAIIHRDYTLLGAVHVRREDDWLTISNPGGFLEGITLDNLLVVEPKPRNPLLADVVKRIGLAERTGRGVDRIYAGLLRYGRPEPDYSRSDRTTVVVRLNLADADVPFVRLIQKDESTARAVLEGLVEAGLVDGHGSRQGRVYTLSAQIYRTQGQGADYVRQAGFDRIQQEQMIKTYVDRHGRIARRDVIELCRVGHDQATRLLRKLVRSGDLARIGEGKAIVYQRK